MKTFRKISVVLLVIGIVVATFFACSKEKEQANVQTATETIINKPIATTDLKTGITTYTYSVDEYQALLNEITSTKTEDDYIFESIEILDNDAKTNISELTLECSIVDVSRERSIAIWLNDEFFDIINDGSTRQYFIKQEILEGNYSFLSHCASGTYLITVTNNVFSVELCNDWKDAKSNRPPKKRQVSCSKDDCRLGTCQPADFGDYGWGCNDCTPSGPHPRCTTHIAPDTLLLDIFLRLLEGLAGGAASAAF